MLSKPFTILNSLPLSNHPLVYEILVSGSILG